MFIMTGKVEQMGKLEFIYIHELAFSVSASVQ